MADGPSRDILETFPTPSGAPGASPLVIEHAAEEFTSLCPITGQPDFAHLVIDYVPGERIVDHALEVDGRRILMTCVSMGNPHAVLYVDDLAEVAVEHIGPALENQDRGRASLCAS